jgi:hypothetical protein
MGLVFFHVHGALGLTRYYLMHGFDELEPIIREQYQSPGDNILWLAPVSCIWSLKADLSDSLVGVEARSGGGGWGWDKGDACESKFKVGGTGGGWNVPVSWLDTRPSKDGCDVFWLGSSWSPDGVAGGWVPELGLACTALAALLRARVSAALAAIRFFCDSVRTKRAFLAPVVFCTAEGWAHVIVGCMHSKDNKITHHGMSWVTKNHMEKGYQFRQ